MKDTAGSLATPRSHDHPHRSVHEQHEGVPLRSLRAGQSARVARLTGNDDLVHRLCELGLRVGARIQMIQPGNPCIIQLDGQKFGFRADGAARVFVRTLPACC
ncbi:MAG: FeoA family protein [Isosphaeraceae bacterium]